MQQILRVTIFFAQTNFYSTIHFDPFTFHHNVTQVPMAAMLYFLIGLIGELWVLAIILSRRFCRSDYAVIHFDYSMNRIGVCVYVSCVNSVHRLEQVCLDPKSMLNVDYIFYSIM